MNEGGHIFEVKRILSWGTKEGEKRSKESKKVTHSRGNAGVSKSEESPRTQSNMKV